MRPPDDEIVRKITDGWLFKADLDMQAARVLLSQDPPILFPACFHSQQGAEKNLKAFLTSRQVEFPKTHSIRELLNLLATIDSILAEKLEPSSALTPYGVELRYPGDVSEPTIEESRKALDIAESVQAAILGVLKPDSKTGGE